MSPEIPEYELPQDSNIDAFYRCLNDPEWTEYHLGVCVVFMFGVFFASSKSMAERGHLLEKVHLEHPDTPFLYVTMPDTFEKLSKSEPGFVQARNGTITNGLFFRVFS